MSLMRIKNETQKQLKEMARQTGESMQFILDHAVEAYRRQRFFEQLNDSVAALKSNPKAWAEELKERKIWEATLADGLESEDFEPRKKHGKFSKRKDG